MKLVILTFGILALNVFAADKTEVTSGWSPSAAAKYMDARETWWQGWPYAKRDHETVCVSCHSVLPYAMARPALRRDLNEDSLSGPEKFLRAGVTKRVTLWNEVEPFYSDEKHGVFKSAEARGTEAVLNAAVLSNEDAERGHLTDVTRKALDAFWALQIKAGEKAGAWNWINFHYSPWESTESQYFGAAMAALAVGTAPDNYASSAGIQDNVALLRGYLQREYDQQPLLNKIDLLWVSSKLPGLMTPEQQRTLVDAIFQKQQDDGGWTVATLGNWQRRDQSTPTTTSDGYATGLIVLALEESGTSAQSPQLKKGVAWLRRNQDKAEGNWTAASVNKQRDPASDRGHFMTDAATAYAVLALEKSH